MRLQLLRHIEHSSVLKENVAKIKRVLRELNASVVLGHGGVVKCRFSVNWCVLGSLQDDYNVCSLPTTSNFIAIKVRRKVP